MSTTSEIFDRRVITIRPGLLINYEAVYADGLTRVVVAIGDYVVRSYTVRGEYRTLDELNAFFLQLYTAEESSIYDVLRYRNELIGRR
jgi:hypothetical protein